LARRCDQTRQEAQEKNRFNHAPLGDQRGGGIVKGIHRLS
jgi:hypothetical protein